MSKAIDIDLNDYIRDIEDFPKPGIVFKAVSYTHLTLPTKA